MMESNDPKPTADGGTGSEIPVPAPSGKRRRASIWPRSIIFWMAVIYLALAIIRPWERLFPVLAKIRIERMYAILMIVAVFFDPKKRFRPNLQTVAIVLFVLALTISGLFAWNTKLAWDRLYEYYTFLIFYFVLILVVRSPYQLTFMVACYIITMAMYLAKAQWEYFINDAGIYTMGVHRMVGIEYRFGSPNAVAMSVVVSLPMWLFLYSTRKTFTENWPPFWKKYFGPGLIAYFVLAVSSIALTNSRSGMVCFVLWIVLVALTHGSLRKKLSFLSAGLLFLVLIWIVLPSEQRTRIRTIWNPDAGPKTATTSAQGRVEGFEAGIKMFSRFHISGVGIGNFKQYRMAHIDGVPLNPHNLIGQVLGENGLLGGLSFLFMIAVALMDCRKVRRFARANPDPSLAVLSGLSQACRYALIILLFEGLVSHNLRRFNWLWLAAFSVLAYQQAVRIVRSTSRSKPGNG